MTGTLMQTYLGRDAGQRVLSGRIVRGVADRIDAAIWFSDLRGFTRITDTTPEQVIPLLNDYADVIVSAIHEHGGDVLKLIGDGTLAMFTADDREARLQRGAGRRDRGARRRGEAQRAARRQRPAGDRHVSRAACRRGVLRQCRQHRAARLHRRRPRRQRGKPGRGNVPLGRPADAGVGGVRRGRHDAAAARVGRPLRAARRRQAAGAVHAGCGSEGRTESHLADI